MKTETFFFLLYESQTRPSDRRCVSGNLRSIESNPWQCSDSAAIIKQSSVNTVNFQQKCLTEKYPIQNLTLDSNVINCHLEIF